MRDWRSRKLLVDTDIGIGIGYNLTWSLYFPPEKTSRPKFKNLYVHIFF